MPATHHILSRYHLNISPRVEPPAHSAYRISRMRGEAGQLVSNPMLRGMEEAAAI